MTTMWVDADDDHVLINTEVHRAKFRAVQRDPRHGHDLKRDDPYTYAEVRGRVVRSSWAEACAHRPSLQKYRGKRYDESTITLERRDPSDAPETMRIHWKFGAASRVDLAATGPDVDAHRNDAVARAWHRPVELGSQRRRSRSSKIGTSSPPRRKRLARMSVQGSKCRRAKSCRAVWPSRPPEAQRPRNHASSADRRPRRSPAATRGR
jgi:hypothetical protein